MVPGRGDRRSMSGAGQAYLRGGERVGKGENRWRKTCPNSNDKEKTHNRHTNSNTDQYDSESRSSTGGMHDACTSAWHMQWSDTRSILLVCRAAAATSPTGLSEGVLVEGRGCLPPADQVSNDSTTNTTSDKNMVPRRKKRFLLACVRQGQCEKTPTLTLLADVLTASPAWAFFFFFGNNVL